MPSPIELPGGVVGNELQIGPNRLTVRGDLVFLHDKQLWDEPGIRELLALFERVRAEYGRLYLISDAQTSGHMSGPGRSLFVKWFKTQGIDLVVVITGASQIAARGLIALVQGAIRLITGRHIVFQIRKTLVEAQALVDQHRAQASAGR